MAQTQQPDFESIKQTNVYDIEFWSARDLYPLLGYTKWERFDVAIQKAREACANADQHVDDHFPTSWKVITAGKGAKQQVKDYLLSRLACYLVAMNGDSRKPEVAHAQTYFAVSTRAHEMHQLREEQEKRLEKRLKVGESYKQLGVVAKGSGVNSESFGIFIDAGYLGLSRHTVAELKIKKGIPEDEDYLDNITKRELSAIDFKNEETIAKLERDPADGLDEASQAHYFIGDQVRRAIEAMHGPMPEDLPSASSIRKMVEERRRKQKKLKRGAAPPNGDHEQGSLF